MFPVIVDLVYEELIFCFLSLFSVFISKFDNMYFVESFIKATESAPSSLLKSFRDNNNLFFFV